MGRGAVASPKAGGGAPTVGTWPAAVCVCVCVCVCAKGDDRSALHKWKVNIPLHQPPSPTRLLLTLHGLILKGRNVLKASGSHIPPY